MTGDPVVVATGGAEEAACLADLDAAAFDTPWSADAWRELLGSGLTRVWIARRGGQAVGAALLRVVAGEGELLRIAVRPEARRQGIGGRLLRALASAAADACPLGVHLEVRASNAEARQLYRRHGFVEQGRRRDYYASPREDAVLMQLQPGRGGALGCGEP